MKPISNTAFYCCGVRMQDAASAAPVCGDNLAMDFLDERGFRIFEPFRSETFPNAQCVARHRIIDDLLRARLAADPKLCVVIIGAGFDSRAYRLDGGIWIEIDEPRIFEYKNARLPASKSKNELHRVPIDFAAESLESKLAPYVRHESVVFVIEGVFMYLTPGIIVDLISTLQRLFPKHTMICDLLSLPFFKRYVKTLHEKFQTLGATFTYTVDAPSKIFTDNGYRIAGTQSIPVAAAEFGIMRVPRFVVRFLMPAMAKGYVVTEFDFG